MNMENRMKRSFMRLVVCAVAGFAAFAAEAAVSVRLLFVYDQELRTTLARTVWTPIRLHRRASRR